MKVTGFTFIRNAVKFDYPVAEAIKSILPVCDDFVVAVGNSDDDTLGLIRSINPDKIKIIETVWGDSEELKKKGEVFAFETDKAFRAIPEDSDWAFYIQGDEVIHEKYLETILSDMKKWKEYKEVDGLLFRYLHFYGSFDYIGNSPRWYNNEIRIIRNNKTFYSYRDAQGFRKGDNEKLNVKPVDACVYHYGWVKEPSVMARKLKNTQSFYNDLSWIQKTDTSQSYDYSAIDSLALFKETHPEVMKDYIKRKNWNFDYDISFNKMSPRYRAKIFLKKYFGLNFFYKNYKII